MLHLPMRIFILLLMLTVCSPVTRALAAAPSHRGELPTGQRLPHEHRGDHFVVLHDTTVEDAALRAAWLEETTQHFSAAFAAPLFPTAAPDEPMICLLFEKTQDFLKYAQAADRMDMRWSKGYYSARTNRVALFGHRELSEPVTPLWPKASQAAVASAASGVHMVSGSVGDDPAARSRWHSSVAAPTTHEAAHQLAFNTGLQRRGVMYPLWVSEGLATCFEAHEPDQPFGPGHVNPLRQRHLERARQRGLWMPLAQFVSLTQPPMDDPQRLDAIYAQSWSLFHFLYNHRREQLAGYLWTLSHLRQGTRSSEAMAREFEHAFGAIEQVEAQWLTTLPPLETVTPR
jgi:hypothetical protein